MTPVVLAAAPGDNRLVVIVLRGAMDGLAAFPPLGDPALAAMRPRLAATAGVQELDDRFGLHPALAPLMPLWRRGQLAVAQAVATPYRGKRSHFDGQDLLEAGVTDPGEIRDGWLNRALALIPGARGRDGAVGRAREHAAAARRGADPRLVAGGPAAAAATTSAGCSTGSTPTTRCSCAALQAAEGLSGAGRRAPEVEGEDPIARFAGERLAAEARIAAFSIGGWDTHVGQANAIVAAAASGWRRRSSRCDAALGPAWDRTLVVAMTEFGRTARENGSGGTDHGTGGAALLAGGAVRGRARLRRLAGARRGRALPGPRPDADDRRAPLSRRWRWRRSSASTGGAIERDVFPGLDMGAAPQFIA